MIVFTFEKRKTISKFFQDDEMKFGPFSDGEAETIKRLPRLSRRGGHPQGRSQHPHYATMSRRLEGRDDHVGRLRGGPRYSSQPQLNQSRDRSDTAIPGNLNKYFLMFVCFWLK